MATSFNVNRADLEFILKQIKIAEATSLGYTPSVAPVSVMQAIMEGYGLSASDATIAPFGLRTVDGTYNSLIPGNEKVGAADQVFPRLTDPVYRNDADGDSIDFDGPGGQPATVQGNYGLPGTVVDADPRIISNLIVDMSVNNPAAITAYLGNPLSLAQFEADHPGMTPLRPGAAMVPSGLYITNEDLQTIPNLSPDIGLSPGFNAWMTFFGQFFDHGLDLVTKANNGTVYIPLAADDPLIAGADGILGGAGAADDLPPHLRFMALTRAAPTMVDPDGAGPKPAVAQHTNTTTSFVDQNQTYTSHSSHQVFLREYKKVDIDGPTGNGPVAVSTGRLLDGTAASGSVAGAVGNWAEVKAQAIDMLGIKLSDFDVHNVPLLATDQYGKFLPSATGYAQVTVQVQIFNASGALVGSQGGPFLMSGVSGGLDLANLPVPAGLPLLPAGQVYKTVSIGTGHAFLDDIAHHAAPSIVDHDHNPATPKIKQVGDSDVDANHNGIYDAGDTLTDVNGDGVTNTADFFADDGNAATYDDEMLNAHFITGDGRGNENIALTTVHSIFHSEHNRLVDVNKATILASGDAAFLNEWLLVDQPTALTAAQVAALDPASLTWDGERLFQAARFSTEMQYQHLVFEEFARRIQPMVDPFVFNSSPDVDPAIVAEFAHTVYRFGHSMLTGTVDRLDNNLDPLNGDLDQKSLLAVFLNPQAYVGSGATLEQINANIVRGLSRAVGNSMDEFIVSDVRSNLLGLPLDLAALNIARARETGIPSLNETRAQLYNDTGLADLKPYASWADFAQNIKNAASVVNFIAAYGTHASILSATTLADKRAAAEELVFNVDGPDADTAVAADRVQFLNGTGAYASDLGGLNAVDLWIGGLAEKINEFGGMLGSTFNYVFEAQMENLQNGDRLYYLTRTQGTNFLNQLEPNTFSDLVMRNSELGSDYATHVNGALFVTPDHIIELDQGIAQEDYNGAVAGKDPEWDGADPVTEAILGPKVFRDYTGGSTVMVDPDGAAGPLPAVAHNVGGTLRFLGGEHVVLGGTEGNDKLYGDKGIDTLWGDGGNDYLNAGMESDDVFGGAGDDVIEDPFGDDVLRGNQGNDVITSARGADLLFGDDGKDYIAVGQDASEVFAGTGDDFVLGGNGKDFLLGNEGNDWMEGGGGFDTLAGDNSELFFNSPIQGHDVLFGHGDETDYDAESGDDIMGSGPSVYRYEGMWGFDWGIAKFDNSQIRFDLQIPIFTTIPEDVLRDRFDQTEALSGWVNDDRLDGDDRGHSGGSSSPDSTPVELFTDHTLTQDGLNRIAGLQQLLGGASITSFKNGNILLGGDGNDIIRGRGGFDTIDGDAWLNVRIKIEHNGVTYSAESLTTDTTVAGPYAGKVFNTNPDGSPNFDAPPAFDGRSLQSLMLDRTINPGEMSIVREILHDNTNVTGAGKNIDTAMFQGGSLEYEIEGTRIVYDATTGEALRRVNIGQGDNSTQALNIRDVDGDGFIRVKDLDDGLVAAPGRVGGLTVSRGALTDDVDLLKNMERLQFADTAFNIGGTTNTLATGTVTISDPTPFDFDNNPATASVVSPIVGQVLTATLSNFADLDGLPLDPATGMPVGLTFDWETTEAGNDGGWAKISSGLTYTVRPVDPAHVLRAVAVFKDSAGVTERIASIQTDNVTAPFSIAENTSSGSVIAPVPFSLDYDPLGFGGTGVTDGDVVQLTHMIQPGQDAGGRFTIVNTGTAAAPVYQLAVANGGPQMLDYEAPLHTPANQSHQFADNQYQIVIDTYTDTIANGGALMASRQFTILLNDVTGEIVNIAPTLDLHADATTTTPTPVPQAYRDTFETVAYNNSIGTSNWTAAWTETGDDNLPATGEIAISAGQLRFNPGADNNDVIVRSINGLPADISAATLSFEYRSVGLDDGFLGQGDRERIIVEVRNTAAGAWTQVGNLGGSTPGAGMATFSQAINPTLLGTNTQIRLRVDTSAAIGQDNDFEAGESFSIDNVNLAIARNIATTVSGTPGNNYTAATYTEGGPGVAIASNAAVGDVDDTLLMGATVRLTNAQAGDVLSIQGTLPSGVTSSFGPAVSGVITMYLTGNGPISKGALQTAIGQVRFSNDGENPNPTATATPRTIAVTVNDGVAESLIAIATVNVAGVDDPFAANPDRIVTNIANANFVVPEWALLANDGDPDTAAVVPDITAVSGATGITNLSLNNVTSVVTLQDNGAPNGSFIYTANFGTTANVAVVRDTAGDLTGGAGNDILVGDGGNSSFQGGAGNDIVFAGVGNDTMVWNANATGATDGRDFIDGGNSNINPAATGSVVVTGAGGANGNRLRFTQDADGTETITRAVDLTGATSAILSFTWQVDDTEGDDDLLVQAFNGTSWDTIGTLDGGGAEDTDAVFSVPLTAAHIGAHSAIRFVSPNLDAGILGFGAENFYIDNVNILTPTGNFRDQFSSQNYANTNGTRVWTPSWVEANDLAETDTVLINGNDTAEDFKVYAKSNAVAAGFTDLKVDTEIVITRNGVVIAELDNVEEITINTGGGTDSVTPIGNFLGTSLSFNTITINGEAGDDTVDISSLGSAHRIVFKSNGGNDTIIGTLRPQDVIELPEGGVAADYVSSTANGVTTLTGPNGHKITYTAAPGAAPAIGTDEEEQPGDGHSNPIPGAGEEDEVPPTGLPPTAGSGDEEEGEDEDENEGEGEDDEDDAGSVPTPPTAAGTQAGPRVGTANADVLVGSALAEDIIAFAGDDVIMAGGGDDTVSAGEGADFIRAGAGRDIVFAGAGDDQVFAEDGNDMVYGEAGNDRMFAGAGNDLVDAGAGDDTVFGGAGNDLFLASIGDGTDTYYGDDQDGGAGVDTLDMSAILANAMVDLGTGSRGSATSSQSGTDILWSIENVITGSGSDTITAGIGVNVLDGGDGNDTFRFESVAAINGDRILGFEPGDKIDLSGIDANYGSAGDQAFTIASGTALTAAGQLTIAYETTPNGEITIVQGNVDATLGADFRLEIQGHHTLTNQNFGL